MRESHFSALALAVLLALGFANFSPGSRAPISSCERSGLSPVCSSHAAFQASGPYSYVVDGSFEGLEWSCEMGGSVEIGVGTSWLHKVSGEVALNLNTKVEEYAFVYQVLSCNESTYKLVFWIYQESAYGETMVEVTSLRPWLENRTWTPQASVFIVRNGSILVDAWRTSENDPPLKTLDCNFTLKAWHKVVFDADGVSKTQRVYIDDNLSATLTSSSGTVFPAELLLLGDISTAVGFGDYYYDDVDLLADVPNLTVSIYPPSVICSRYQNVRFDVTARGGKTPYSYQWYIDDIPAGNQSSISYLPPNPCTTQTIRVNVTDAEGNSQTAQAMVYPQPPQPPQPPKPLSVSITPIQASVDVNNPMTFSASVNGGVPSYSYQWYLDGVTIQDASGPSWSFTPTEPTTYTICVGVTDSNNTSVLSSNATLEAFPALIPVSRDYELVEATIEGGSIATVDPAASYDTASGELITNCYDTLVCFDGERMDRYLPSLATDWSIIKNDPPLVSAHTGLDFYYTYYFKIRTGVPWQDPAFGTVTPGDVEYTFERGMVLEPGDNPQWMFYEPLLNGATLDYIDGVELDTAGNVTEREFAGWAIDEAVESNSTHVWFNIAYPGAYAPFMQVLTQQWASIVCKAWANSLGRASNWNGDWGADHTAYYAFHSPEVPPFDDPAPAVMGSGPFKLARLDQTWHYWVADRFVDYWRGWPIDWPAIAGSRPAGFVDRLRVTWAYDWNTRSQMFLNGEVDLCAVPRQYISQVQGQPGIRCTYPLPSLACDAYFFQFNINSTSPYGPILSPGTFNESGIPADFFGNTTWGVHIRKAFASVINYDDYMASAFLGEAVNPATVIVPALPYYDPTVKGYSYNLTRAVEELKQVPNLWDTGFTFKLIYNVGCCLRPIEVLGDQISQAMNSLNPKFHVTTLGVDWASYLAASRNSQLPIFTVGWLADYPDAHNFVYPYYYTYGNFAYRAHYSNAEMDSLIDEGIRTSDGPARAALYSQIQQLAVEDCPNIVTASAVGRHFERNWVCGWYYNPAYPGVYAANVWKWYYVPQALNETAFPPTSDCLPFDINYDGKINMSDINSTAACFGAVYGPPLSPSWNFMCDVNNDRKIDMRDLGRVAWSFDKTSPNWSPPP